jgi:hypothetical protein
MMVPGLSERSGKVKVVVEIKPVKPETGNGRSDSQRWVTPALEADV